MQPQSYRDVLGNCHRAGFDLLHMYDCPNENIGKLRMKSVATLSSHNTTLSMKWRKHFSNGHQTCRCSFLNAKKRNNWSSRQCALKLDLWLWSCGSTQSVSCHFVGSDYRLQCTRSMGHVIRSSFLAFSIPCQLLWPMAWISKRGQVTHPKCHNTSPTTNTLKLREGGSNTWCYQGKRT